MTGRIQHHIPKSFQRGFLIRNQSTQTHVYHIGKNYVSNIDRVAAQRDFYSKPSRDGTKTLDDIITDYEDRLGRLLSTLRAVEMGALVDSCIAAEVIAHLTPRGNIVRRMFCDGFSKHIMGTSEILSDENVLLSMIGLAEPAPNKTWNNHIASAFNEDTKLTQTIELILKQTKIPKASLDRILFIFGKESILWSTPLTGELQKVFSDLLDRIVDVIIDSHRKMLTRGVIAEPRKQALEELTWNIRPAPKEGAIMPDCIALGFDEEEGKFLPYIMTSTASAIVMPLTSQKLLVGVRAGSTITELFGFNHEASECSDDFFIAASSAHADLSENIGKRWRGKMDSIVQNALGRLHGHSSIQSTVPAPAAPTPFANYQLTFIGWPAEDDIVPISGTVQSIVEKFCLWLDLTRFDGITFTSEFRKTLTETEHGFDTNATPEGIPDHIAQGAAALLVVRDGVPKLRIVLSKEYALFLVGKDMRDAGVTLHLLVAGLSLAHTVNQFESTLPGYLMEPVMADNHDAVLHCAMRKALRAYRYAYDSAEFGAEDLIEHEFSNYLIHAFDLAYAHIAKAKEEHATDGDHPKLFKAAHGAATEILIASARLIGHLDSMGKTPLLTSETSAGAAIAARQLTGWVNAFAYDLQQFWKKKTWTREDFHALNIHVERLLWPCGIVLYPADSGQGTMILSFQSG